MKKMGLFFSLIVVFIISGCATDSHQIRSDSNYYDSAQLGLASEQRFEDIPVPAGFILYRKESFIFQNNRMRMGTMIYTGSADFMAIIEFYKKQMPINSWRLLTTVEFDKVVMSFENDSESCIINIEKRGRKVMISIGLSPVSKGAVVITEKYHEEK